MKKGIMMNRIFVLLLVAGGLSLTSCGDDYDDTWVKETTTDLEKRVAALEEWQKTVNSQIFSLQSVISNLEGKDYVTKVTPLANETGYVISFQNSGDVTILNGEKGEKGDSPVISVKKDTDGIYYWTVNGEWLTDGTNKMPVTGEKGKEAIAPQVQINSKTNEWEVSTDGGTTWKSTGVKATGDSMFSKIDVSNSDYVELTLASDSSTIQLPYYTNSLRLVNYSGKVAQYEKDQKFQVILPSGLTKSTYGNVIATITPTSSASTRAVSGWSVSLGKVEFDTDGKLKNEKNYLEGTVSIDKTVADGETALLTVYLNYRNGKQESVSYLVENAVTFVSDATSFAKFFTDLEDLDTKTVTLSNDITDLTSQLTVSQQSAITVDLNGHKLANSTDIWNTAVGVNAWSVFSVSGDGAYLRLEDSSANGTGQVVAKKDDAYAVDVREGALLEIYSGYYNGNKVAVYVHEGTAIIYGGVFDIQQLSENVGREHEFVINCYDPNRAAGKARITVYGGTFVGFNPADCWAEGEHTNFVADGYESVETTYNGKKAWKVQEKK